MLERVKGPNTNMHSFNKQLHGWIGTSGPRTCINRFNILLLCFLAGKCLNAWQEEIPDTTLRLSQIIRNRFSNEQLYGFITIAFENLSFPRTLNSVVVTLRGKAG